MEVGTTTRNADLFFLFLILSIAVFQLSCEGDGGGVGPCIHIYEEPILHIESARDIQSGVYLKTIVLSNITIDSIPLDPFFLIPESRYVAALESVLVCNLPCAFGTQPGQYNFKVSANGYRDTIITCYPDYTIYKGGCPSSSNGGLRINIDLRPN
ncbi:MAG TPA: hypothetical protein PK595_03680 [Bacteroidota bacterium]|nr:hypothetical protein [Bacteroidota bacterium]